MHSKLRYWTSYHTIGLFVLIVGIALCGLLIPEEQLLLAWLLTLCALFVFAMLAGHGITGNFWLGWLVNEQNRASLSRLQMVLWTVVVLSAFLTTALVNVRNERFDQALNIRIPQSVWLAMGINTVSLVGSPLILSQKKAQETNTDRLRTTIARTRATQVTAEDMARFATGNVFRNESPEEAHLSDLIRGEEVGNASVLDLTRLQNLFFTLILIGAYMASLAGLLASTIGASTSSLSQLPDLSGSSVTVLGISHAGYLVSKAIDKQPEPKSGP